MVNKNLYVILFALMPLSVMASNGISTSLYTGGMSYTIPVYTIEDPDFHLDITLRYNSEGFKPFQPSGCYGQGWTLVAGGCITRSVQGIADEQRIKYTTGMMAPDWQVGMLQAIKDGENPTKESVFDFTTPLYKPTCGIQYYQGDYIYYSNNPSASYCDWDRDYMSDIYTFSFYGKKGCFTINNTGKPIIISGDFVDIDFSNFRELSEDNNSHNSFYIPSDSSRITIRTTDGFYFEFGGSHNAMEYSTYVTKNNTVDQHVPVISAWYLTQIIAPNGRSLNFNYVNSFSSSVTSLHSFITDYDWTEQDNGNSSHIVYSLHKECLLQSITTSDSVPLSVSFHAHPEPVPMYENTDITYSVPHTMLDSVVVRYGNKVLRKAQLSYLKRSYNISQIYNSPDPDFNWRYLQQVSISGVGKYAMTYKYFDPYPDSVSTNPPMIIYHLHWYPDLYPQTDDAYKNTVDRFGFWKISAQQGMLENVSLPTGGKLSFTYEDHQYGEERRYRVVGTQDIELYSQSVPNQSIGGLRIKKIETFSNANSLVETQTFSYNKQGTSISSGIFNNIYEVFYPSNPNNGHQIANPNNYSLINSHIGYSYVEKETTIGADTYKTAYTFDTGRSSYSSVGNNLIHRSPTAIGTDSVELSSGSLTFDGWLVSPGKLLKTEQYNGNTLVKSVQFKYNGVSETPFGPLNFGTNSLGCLDTIVCLSKYSAHIARKLLVCPDVLEQITTNEYDSNGQIMTSSTDYIHDSKLRPKNIVTIDSRGVQHFTKYTYPDDIPGADVYSGTPTPLFVLINTNSIGTPVETLSGYTQSGTEYITNGTINLYENNTFTENDSVLYLPYLSKVLSLALSEPLNKANYNSLGISNNQVIFDPNYKLVCQYSFDRLYRLTSIKPFGEKETRYSWSGLYPASKTIGNQITTYTYLPYVGINSITDSRGITTYYTYDSAGRLVEEYQLIDGQKKVLNVYQYHIKTE